MFRRFALACAFLLPLFSAGITQAQDLLSTQIAVSKGTTAHAQAAFTLQCAVKNAGTKDAGADLEVNY